MKVVQVLDTITGKTSNFDIEAFEARILNLFSTCAKREVQNIISEELVDEGLGTLDTGVPPTILEVNSIKNISLNNNFIRISGRLDGPQDAISIDTNTGALEFHKTGTYVMRGFLDTLFTPNPFTKSIQIHNMEFIPSSNAITVNDFITTPALPLPFVDFPPSSIVTKDIGKFDLSFRVSVFDTGSLIINEVFNAPPDANITFGGRITVIGNIAITPLTL